MMALVLVCIAISSFSWRRRNGAKINDANDTKKAFVEGKKTPQTRKSFAATVLCWCCWFNALIQRCKTVAIVEIAVESAKEHTPRGWAVWPFLISKSGHLSHLLSLFSIVWRGGAMGWGGNAVDRYTSVRRFSPMLWWWCLCDDSGKILSFFDSIFLVLRFFSSFFLFLSTTSEWNGTL